MAEKPRQKHGFMDELDYRIIEHLDRNSRAKNIEIARKLRVSEGTVRKRIQDLVDSGVIKKFTIEFGVKRGLKAFVLIKYAPGKSPAGLVKFLGSIPQVKSVYQLAGRWDIITRIFTESSHEFNHVIDRIRSRLWVVDTESLIVLEIE
jgi:Lrp/AsnC family transcriptional regulator of lysine biosynthesis